MAVIGLKLVNNELMTSCDLDSLVNYDGKYLMQDDRCTVVYVQQVISTNKF